MLFQKQQIFQSKIDFQKDGTSLTDFPITLNILSQDIRWTPVFWENESDISLGGLKRSNIRGYDITLSLDYNTTLEPTKITDIIDTIPELADQDVEMIFYPDASDDTTFFEVIPTSGTQRAFETRETITTDIPTLTFENKVLVNTVAGAGSPVLSGGDADTLNGLTADQFLRSDTDDTFESSNTLTIAGKLAVNNTGVNSFEVGGIRIFNEGEEQKLGTSDEPTFNALNLGSEWLLDTEEVGSVDRLSLRAQAGNEDMEVFLHPIGSADSARLEVSNNPNLSNFNSIAIESDGSAQRLISRAEGSANLLPLQIVAAGDEEITFWTNGVERVSFDSSESHFKGSGNTTLRISSTGSPTTFGARIRLGSTTSSNVATFELTESSNTLRLGTFTNNSVLFVTNGTERGRFTPDGDFRFSNDLQAGGTVVIDSTGKLFYSGEDTDNRYSQLGHTHDASEIVSGTFADARIALSNVTQHGDGRYGRLATANVWVSDQTIDPGSDTFQRFHVIRGTGTAKRSLEMTSNDIISRDDLGAIRSRIEFGDPSYPLRFYEHSRFLNNIRFDGNLLAGGTAIVDSSINFQNANSYRTTTTTTDFSHISRDSASAALYVSQVSAGIIARFAGETTSPNSNVRFSVENDIVESHVDVRFNTDLLAGTDTVINSNRDYFGRNGEFSGNVTIAGTGFDKINLERGTGSASLGMSLDTNNLIFSTGGVSRGAVWNGELRWAGVSTSDVVIDGSRNGFFENLHVEGGLFAQEFVVDRNMVLLARSMTPWGNKVESVSGSAGSETITVSDLQGLRVDDIIHIRQISGGTDTNELANVGANTRLWEDTTGWVAPNTSAFEVTTSDSFFGSTSLRVGLNSSNSRLGTDTGFRVPAVDGDVVKIGCWVKKESGTDDAIQLLITLRDDTESFIGEFVSSNKTMSTSEWTFITFEETMTDPDLAFADFRIRSESGGSNDITFLFDGAFATVNGQSVDVKRIVRKVASVSSQDATLTTTGIDWTTNNDIGSIEVGDDFVVRGNTSDIKRDGIIEFRVSDVVTPTISFLDDITDVYKGDEIMRLGWLGDYGADFGAQEIGIAAEISGELAFVLSDVKGFIGGFTFEVDNGTGHFYREDGSGNFLGLQSATSNDTLAFFAGADDKTGSNALFSVQNDGKIFHSAIAHSLFTRESTGSPADPLTASQAASLTVVGSAEGTTSDESIVVRRRYFHRDNWDSAIFKFYGRAETNEGSQTITSFTNRVRLKVFSVNDDGSTNTELISDSTSVPVQASYSEREITLDLSSLTGDEFYEIQIELFAEVDILDQQGTNSSDCTTFLRSDYDIIVGT